MRYAGLWTSRRPPAVIHRRPLPTASRGESVIRSIVASWRRSRRDGEEEVKFMQALADSGGFWVLLLVAIPVVYMLPTLIGLIRGVDGLALVFLVNLIGAPTGVGWLGAMILAFGPRKVPPPPPPYWRVGPAVPPAR